MVLLVGALIGTLSGMIGIGGGVLVIPVLMIGFGFAQAKANSTSLAMRLPPIGAFAVLSYWRAGDVDWRFAALLAVGFAGGAFVGAKVVNTGAVNAGVVRLLFAGLLLYIVGRILFQAGGTARAALHTSALVAALAGTYLGMVLLGRRWERRPPPDWAAVYRRRRQQPVQHDYEI